MKNKIINFDAYLEEIQKACELTDEVEKETQLSLLHKIKEAEQDWEFYMRKYEYKSFLTEIKNRGIRFTPVNDRATKAKWTKLFAADISKGDRKKIYYDDYKWHLFSYELLDALTDDAARAAFDAESKDTVYLFWQRGKKAYRVENAHLFHSSEFDHDFIPFQDFYLFSPEGKWTYIRTHEIMCGPYFYKLP